MKPDLVSAPQETAPAAERGGAKAHAAPKGFAELLAKASVRPLAAPGETSVVQRHTSVVHGRTNGPQSPSGVGPGIPAPGLTPAARSRGPAPRGEAQGARAAASPAAAAQVPRSNASPLLAPATTAKAAAVESARPALTIIGKAPAVRPGRLAILDKPALVSAKARDGIRRPRAERDKKEPVAPRTPQLLPAAHPPLPGEQAPPPVSGKHGKHPAAVEAAGKPRATPEPDKAELPAGVAPAEKKVAPESLAKVAATALNAPDAPVFAPPVAPPPPAALPLLHQAAEDPGLRVSVLSHSASVAIEGSDGNLALHVRVKDGAADVRIGGTMAPLFEARAPEIQAALAGQGLALGRYDLDDQRRRQDQYQPHDPGDAAPSSRPAIASASASSTTTTAVDGRIHVTA
jgi:flagellar hook-length control protein FliK